MKILAIHGHYFGFGKNAAEARSNLKSAGGKVAGCSIYEVPDDYWIDQLGRAHGSGRAKLIEGPDTREPADTFGVMTQEKAETNGDNR